MASLTWVSEVTSGLRRLLRKQPPGEVVVQRRLRRN
jgi:hypothetical protein